MGGRQIWALLLCEIDPGVMDGSGGAGLTERDFEVLLLFQCFGGHDRLNQLMRRAISSVRFSMFVGCMLKEKRAALVVAIPARNASCKLHCKLFNAAMPTPYSSVLYTTEALE